LGALLGVENPDVVALRLWKQLIVREEPTERFAGDLPLFNVGFQAFVEATALSGDASTKLLDTVALGLSANSPWTLWRSSEATHISKSWSLHPTPHSTFVARSEFIDRLNLVENIWREGGFAVESRQVGKSREVRATRNVDNGPHIFEAAYQAEAILDVPD